MTGVNIKFTYRKTNAKTENVFKSFGSYTYDLWQTSRNLNIYYVTTYPPLEFSSFFSFRFRSTTFHIFKFLQKFRARVSFLSHIYSTTIYIRSLYRLTCNMLSKYKAGTLSTWILIHFMHFYCGIWKRHSYIQYRAAFVGTFGVWKTCVYSTKNFCIEYSIYCCLQLYIGTTLIGYLFCIYGV